MSESTAEASKVNESAVRSAGNRSAVNGNARSYDEITLRDLYLIVLRGLPLILIVSALAGIAALLVVNLRSERFQAEATVLINPTPVRVQGGGSLVLEQRNDISWETYQSLAYSTTVLEDALARLGDRDLTLRQLRRNSELTRLVGPQQANQVAPLTISHAVTHPDPLLAAAAADAWAAAALATAGANLVAGLESVRSATGQQLRSIENRLAELEERWQEFQSRDESELIEFRLAALGERMPEIEATVEEAQRRISASQAARAALTDLEPAGAAGGVDEALAAVALLAGRNLLPSVTVAELTALLQEGGATETDLVTLVRQVEVQRLTADIAGQTAQRDTASEQLERLRQQAQQLREEQAGLILERDRLEQQLEVARSAHGELAELEPVLEYISELAPTNSRFLNNASIPGDPTGPRPLLVAILAAVVGGLLALLFVFLRAAVEEPGARAARETAPSAPAA